MAQRSPAEADRYIEEMEQRGLNDSHLRLMRSATEEARSAAHGMASDASQRHFDTARRIGSETRDEFVSIAEKADAITRAIATGELRPEEGRRAIDGLLGRHNLASTRAETFDRSATAAVEIEDDPEAWSEAFYRAHPTVRPEMGW